MAKPKNDLEDAAETTNALNPIVGLNREELVAAVATMLRSSARRPMKTARHAMNYGSEVVEIIRGNSEREAHPKDRRFMDPAWKTNPIYRRILQSFLAGEAEVGEWIADMDLGEMDEARARFVSGMIIDTAAPTNTLLGNPTALKKVIDTGGTSLMRGLKNAYNDMRTNQGLPSQVDKRPFEVGVNLATSEGAVVYKTEIVELIQYKPQTAEVYKIPLLIIPPQINKFYANDLSPDKSVVQWLTKQGFQLFCVSWRNPQAENAHWGLTDYIDELIKVTDAIQAITRSKKINLCGACSGGITTTTLASKLISQNDDRVNAITLEVCVLDPQPTDSDVGSLVSERGIEMARKRSKEKGILEGASLARSFAWLRPNDLIWSYVINNYLLGEDPPPFDILFWNADHTNLSAQLHSDYLDIYKLKPFTKPGEEEFAGHLLDTSKITVDTMIVAGVRDHITPWKACYRTTQILGSDNIEFVLSNSGHIQSLLNPPGNPKSKYYRGDKTPADVDEWMRGAQEFEGSWWTYWFEWLGERSGEKKNAPRKLGNKAHPVIEAAPGSYVFD